MATEQIIKQATVLHDIMLELGVQALVHCAHHTSDLTDHVRNNMFDSFEPLPLKGFPTTGLRSAHWTKAHKGYGDDGGSSRSDGM